MRIKSSWWPGRARKTSWLQRLMRFSKTRPVKVSWGEVGLAATSQQPLRSPFLSFFCERSGLVSRSWWVCWQMGLKPSLSTSVPNCSWRGRNLLRPPDCFWYVLTSLPKVFPCSNYCVNGLLIGRPRLQVKQTPQETRIQSSLLLQKCTFWLQYNYIIANCSLYTYSEWHLQIAYKLLLWVVKLISSHWSDLKHQQQV